MKVHLRHHGEEKLSYAGDNNSGQVIIFSIHYRRHSKPEVRKLSFKMTAERHSNSERVIMRQRKGKESDQGL